jgi:hypothetical protein
MRFLRYLPLAALMFVGACDKEASITNVARPPLAFIRYVHAVPDFGPTDFKFVDAVEYSPVYANTTFRTVGIYQGVRAGNRQWRVFRNSSNIAETQQVIAEATTNFEAGKYYTILHRGFAAAANGTPAQGIVLIEDTRPDFSAGNIHWRSVNAIVGLTNQDVFVGAPAGTPAASNVPPGAASGYAVRATGTFTIHTAATGTLVSLASGTPFAGVAGTTAVDPVGGFNIAGTLFTAFHFPRSVAGSAAPQTAAFTSPAVTLIVDRQPPRTVPE